MKANFESALIKLLTAFFWHECYITDADIIFEPEANEAGAALLPVINAFGNSLNDFEYYDQNFQVLVYHSFTV